MNTPTTPEEAAAQFRCDRYLCAMSGNACASSYQRAVQTKTHHRERCIGCAAGEARVTLLDFRPLRCNMPKGQDELCGAKLEPGTMFCKRHAAQRANVNMAAGKPSGRSIPLRRDA